jgi:DNA-binding LytR/AlgR family response regulator
MPAVVFLTAYDQFALNAPDACALDYGETVTGRASPQR